MLFNEEHRILVLHKSELNKGGKEAWEKGKDLLRYFPKDLRPVLNANIVIVYGDLGEESQVLKNRYGFNCPTEIPERYWEVITDLMDVNTAVENEKMPRTRGVLQRLGVNSATRVAASLLPMNKVEIVYQDHLWEAI